MSLETQKKKKNKMINPALERFHTHKVLKQEHTRSSVNLRAFKDKITNKYKQTNESYFSKMVMCFQCHMSRASSLLSWVTKRETSSQAESRLMTHLVQRCSAARSRGKQTKPFSDSPFTHGPAGQHLRNSTTKTDIRGNYPRLQHPNIVRNQDKTC